ncbi:motility associated factor glycosyltransferase family protein [Clostridium felsineum]|uniref:motility associated factor glycosyltransferase family protein n=1 Tax=Clostridium felsineum TaxID=36839 RepID=UPI0009CAC314|nr:motility associated factor glycosyltransferase family protein [Clostridium felsineum]URZ00974.1 hypothetical protein CLAUR_009620 [Clostridium felsineum]
MRIDIKNNDIGEKNMNTITEITLNNISKEESEYCIEKSKDDKNIMKCFKNGKSIYLGSKYSVQRDIENFFKDIGEYNKESVFICFGLGAGEHIKELLNITENNLIIIIEHDNKVINAFVNKEENLELLKKDRIILTNFCGTDMIRAFQVMIPKDEVNNTNFAFFANYKRVYEKEAIETYKIYADFLTGALIEINTMIVHSKHFYESFMKNLKYILDSVPVNNFKEKYNKNMPAVVVSAGPSLEKNIHFLKEYKDKCVIITGGRTLKTLLDLGIKPDYVCVIDPDIPAYNVMQGTFNCNSPLVFCEYTYSDILRDYRGEKVFFNDIGMLGIQKEFLNYDVDNIYEGGSVAHVCAGLGVYIGCDPIIFIGQDLAYTNDKAHSSSAGDTVIGNKKIIYVENIDGGMVKTDSVLNHYRLKIEEMILFYKQNNFINSTEGGANIKGTKVIPLKKALEKYCSKEKQSTWVDLKISDRISENEVINKLVHAKMKMQILKKELEKYIDLCNSFLGNEKNWNKTSINSLNKKLSKIDKLINSSIKEMEFMRNLIIPNIYELSMDKKYKEKYNEIENDKIKRIYKKNLLLYNGIIESIVDAIPDVEACIKSLEGI